MKTSIWIAVCALTAAPAPAQLELAAPQELTRVLADGSEVPFASLAELEAHARGLAGLAPGEDLLALPIVRDGQVGVLLVGGDAQQIAGLRASLTAPAPPRTLRPAPPAPLPTARPLTLGDVLAPLREIGSRRTSASEAVARFADRYNRAVAAEPNTKVSRKVSRLLRLSAPGP